MLDFFFGLANYQIKSSLNTRNIWKAAEETGWTYFGDKDHNYVSVTDESIVKLIARLELKGKLRSPLEETEIGMNLREQALLTKVNLVKSGLSSKSMEVLTPRVGCH